MIATFWYAFSAGTKTICRFGDTAVHILSDFRLSVESVWLESASGESLPVETQSEKWFQKRQEKWPENWRTGPNGGTVAENLSGNG